MGQHLATFGNQRAQQAVFHLGKVNRLAVAGDLAGAQVHADLVAQGDHAAGRAGVARAAAQQGAYPRLQLAHAKRLGQVIISTGVQRQDFIAFIHPRRQHQHRHVARCLAIKCVLI